MIGVADKWKIALETLSDQSIPPSAKTVYLFLIEIMTWGDDARCNPSFAYLAEQTGLSEHGVKKAVKALRDEGWVAVEQGRGRRVTHSFSFPKLETLAGNNNRPDRTAFDDKSDTVRSENRPIRVPKSGPGVPPIPLTKPLNTCSAAAANDAAAEFKRFERHHPHSVFAECEPVSYVGKDLTLLAKTRFAFGWARENFVDAYREFSGGGELIVLERRKANADA